MSALTPHRPLAVSRGFSLLEVLVAFVILALVATALFKLFGGALNNATAAGDWSRALLLAETQLAAAANAVPLREGSDQGNEKDSPLTWQTKVEAYTPPDVPPELERASETTPTRVYRVTTEVHFPSDRGRDRVVTLTTLRLAARNPL
jgi:general secretion pathway protein I